jgi:hypothetical protein
MSGTSSRGSGARAWRSVQECRYGTVQYPCDTPILLPAFAAGPGSRKEDRGSRACLGRCQAGFAQGRRARISAHVELPLGGLRVDAKAQMLKSRSAARRSQIAGPRRKRSSAARMLRSGGVVPHRGRASTLTKLGWAVRSGPASASMRPRYVPSNLSCRRPSDV